MLIMPMKSLLTRILEIVLGEMTKRFLDGDFGGISVSMSADYVCRAREDNTSTEEMPGE